MKCDPGPVFGLGEDPPDLREGQLAEDPQLEHLPVGLLQRVQRHVDAEGIVLLDGGLLDAPVQAGGLLRQLAEFALPAFFVVEEVPGDGAQPGDLVGFAPEAVQPGKRPEEGLLGDLLRQVAVPASVMA